MRPNRHDTNKQKQHTNTHTTPTTQKKIPQPRTIGIDDLGVRNSINTQLWQQAEWHELGASVVGGADFSALINHDRLRVKKGTAMARGMLLAEANLACWTHERRHRAGHAAPTTVKPLKTQHLVLRATQDRLTLACFFFCCGGWFSAIGPSTPRNQERGSGELAS